MNLVKLVINDRVFHVTQVFVDALMDMAHEADTLATRAYPDSCVPFPIYLTAVGHEMISVIKEYRQHTGQNLKGSKRAIDGVLAYERSKDGGPLLLGKFGWKEGAEIAARFRECGATVDFPSPLELLAREAE